ncbi:peptide chain release factor N(5)-glutamine methyltransferase [Parasulfuritortus cantonensis]|uniref:Release factor glutamine methyltransferase n=1 Tax=Parasulfuritortus cantonensis TaxID=2528202 RepID=A0A4R1BCQ2_9PROT|nr:peptide chain release factor N(5)-glutamine methyltransferase [Parasulfuritortus cantonensis]
MAGSLALSPREARLEARVLAAAVLAVEPVWLLAHDTDALETGQIDRLDAALARRLAGEPVAYIVGEREFYGRPFRVGPATLIPRPETEHLVEAALARGGAGARVLDIGTGSGCIAITLKLERPDWQVTAIDLSAEALAVARDNAERLGAELEWLASDLFAALPGRAFDLIVSNPPYIPAADPHLDRGDVRFEPRVALASGPDGLATIRAIVAEAPAQLAAGGWLLLEHGYDQGDAVPALLRGAGYTEVFLERDLAGLARVSGGRSQRRI